MLVGRPYIFCLCPIFDTQIPLSHQKYTRGLIVGWTPKIHSDILPTTPLNFIGDQKVQNLVSHRPWTSLWSHPLTKHADDSLQLHSAHDNIVIRLKPSTHYPCSWAVFTGQEHGSYFRHQCTRVYSPWTAAVNMGTCVVWTGGCVHRTQAGAVTTGSVYRAWEMSQWKHLRINQCFAGVGSRC